MMPPRVLYGPKPWGGNNTNNAFFNYNIKQLLDEVFVMSRIIKVGWGSDNPHWDLDYSGYHKNLI